MQTTKQNKTKIYAYLNIVKKTLKKYLQIRIWHDFFCNENKFFGYCNDSNIQI